MVLWVPAMSSPSSCKWLCRREFFIPCSIVDTRSATTQKPEGQQGAAQAKWLLKPEKLLNYSHFRWPENTERVRRWRERHPGYWRKKRSSPDALQDLAPTEASYKMRLGSSASATSVTRNSRGSAHKHRLMNRLPECAIESLKIYREW